MRIVGHLLISDLAALVRAGYSLPEHVEWFCTHTAVSWLWPETQDKSLEALVLRMTDMDQWRKTLGKVDMDGFTAMSDTDLFERCGGDAEAALRLHNVVAPELARAGLVPIWTLAMRVLPILATMGGRGMALDFPNLHQRVEENGKRVEAHRTFLTHALGIENLDSNDQLADTLYGKKAKWKAEPLHKTQTGYSVAKVCKLWARYQAKRKGETELADLLDQLLDYEERVKLQSTYYQKWFDECATDQRVHSLYSLGTAQTGRLASSKVNLQNVPEVVRELIVPSPGYDQIIQCDFSQLEFRIAAELSGDPLMNTWIREERDAHSIMAARVMGLPEPQSKTEYAKFKQDHGTERNIGKMANFATIYGTTGETLNWQVFEQTEGQTWLGQQQAQRYVDNFFETFRGYKQYADNIWKKLRDGTAFTTPFGRHWWFEPTKAGWRKGLNYPVQSTASDIVILVLHELDAILKREHWTSRLIGEVHDSIVLETTQKELIPLAKLLRQLCENPPTHRRFGFTIKIPLRVEIKAGPAWGTLQEIHLT